MGSVTATWVCVGIWAVAVLIVFLFPYFGLVDLRSCRATRAPQTTIQWMSDEAAKTASMTFPERWSGGVPSLQSGVSAARGEEP